MPPPSPPTGGCADGSVEVEFNSQVVGCDGTWTTPGLQNGGQLCNQGAGWDICDSDDAVSNRGVSSCAAVTGTTVFYATMESSNGNWNCDSDEPGNTGTNDIWGCGGSVKPKDDACGVLNAAIGTACCGETWNAWSLGSDDSSFTAEVDAIYKPNA
eukprot:467496-Prymnesium_polylepis.1